MGWTLAIASNEGFGTLFGHRFVIRAGVSDNIGRAFNRFSWDVMIRRCKPDEIDDICAVINDSASAYRGIIAADRWKDPYMSSEELRREIDEAVLFWGFVDGGHLLGIMGLQRVGDVALIRHAYTRTASQRRGIPLEFTADQAALRRRQDQLSWFLSCTKCGR